MGWLRAASAMPPLRNIPPMGGHAPCPVRPPIGGMGKGGGFPQNCSPCLTAPVDTDGVRDAPRQPRSDVPGGHSIAEGSRNVAASIFDDGRRDVDGVM